ncbi:MAG: TonB-dependent receptor [Pseudomonadota bacterium]|nr:TonB-dependent receptor [Pseudomonadota bacterium]
MSQRFVPRKHVLALSIATLFASGAYAQTTSADTAPTASSTIVVTGTRVSNRTVLDTTSPVDVISADTLKNAGTTEINQALSVALPSLNFPRPALADGTDTIRPATLRGMAPDQTLVLVNSKRRHSSSLVNLNGTIGRGSSAVDLNTIPTAIVKNIEVLRDGAAAQYGSDAISGVINLRLRTDRDGGEATVNYGARFTEYDLLNAAAPAGGTWTAPNSRKRTDGQSAAFSAWKGFAWGDTGFVTVAAEYKDQSHTERSGYDMRQQYAKLPSGAYDPRENTFNRFSAWYGEPEMKQSTLFVNAGNDLGNGVKIYGWTSYQKRDARSGGYYRPASDVRNITSIYPDGFLPIIAPTVDDYSATGGVTWTLGEWDMDASLGYGKNKMQFEIDNTLNRSIGPTSKTSFDAGGFSYAQTVFNLTGVRKVDVADLASPLNVAVGTELRNEAYKLFAGEPDSYRYGGASVNGVPSAPGAQVFPGFRPANAADTSRSSFAAFTDLEANLTPEFLASIAVRGEHYTDFGNSLAGKFAGRYDFSKQFALRGSVQNGFRAPSPQQQNFTSTSTNFIDGVPFEITTFKPTDPVAVALGAKPLKAEKSVNFSLGGVLRMNTASLTVDAYQIKVKDRIVLSENLTSAAVRNYIVSQGFAGVGGGRFFINGVETKTKGVDVVFNVPYNAGNVGKFDFTVAANVTKTEVTKVPTTTQLAALSPSPVLFDRMNVLTLEKGQPKNKISASSTWNQGPMGATLRATRYGEVLSPGTAEALDFVLHPRTTVDLEGRYAMTPKLSLALGAENLFDQYPETLPPALNTTGNTPFSNYAPFGRAGRYVYARATYAF